ncbi:hypothetical protein SLS60_003299 [Paraconiothyrium brasiliense]|uniref:Uncharacterized protein n=1 Tax=Paraconiothyrium brasiliense TaxID=300254 RepID=A0ABR3RVR0_9PLEO
MTQQEYGYHSIYKGPVYNSNGDFVGFAQNIHEHAQQYGYWRFADDLENRHAVRAHRYGLQNPEQLFSVNQNARGSWHDEIKLTWYPGEKDPYQVSRTGSTGQHMSSIAEERTLVGLPPLLAHEIPVREVKFCESMKVPAFFLVTWNSIVYTRSPLIVRSVCIDDNIERTMIGLDTPEKLQNRNRRSPVFQMSRK